MNRAERAQYLFDKHAYSRTLWDERVSKPGKPFTSAAKSQGFMDLCRGEGQIFLGDSTGVHALDSLIALLEPYETASMNEAETKYEEPQQQQQEQGEQVMTTKNFTNTIVDLNKDAVVAAAKRRAAKEALLLVKGVVSKMNLPPTVAAFLESPFGDLILMNAVASFAAVNGNVVAEKVARVGLEVSYEGLLEEFLPHIGELLGGLASIGGTLEG